MGSVLYMVARQEMEHLSLVNGMLTAIGEPPFFSRQNFEKGGLQSPYFSGPVLAAAAASEDREPVSLPYTLARFDQNTIERFVCGESPPYADLPPDLRPDWCFLGPDGTALCAPAPETSPTPARSHLAAAGERIGAGTVQELYTAIGHAFATLDGLFVASPPEVVLPVEYAVFVFPVTDRPSAVAAVDLILRQGEGLAGPWTYESHFRHFYDVRADLVVLQEDLSFDPAHPLIENPRPSDIPDDFTRAVFEFVDQAYVTLLFMLTGLYARFVPESAEAYPHFSTALGETAVAPTMTMIVRSLSEVLVRLQTGDGPAHAGPGFNIDDEDRELLEHPDWTRLGDIGFYLERWESVTASVERLAGAASPVQSDMDFIHQSAYRITANLRTIYQGGLYPDFVST